MDSNSDSTLNIPSSKEHSSEVWKVTTSATSNVLSAEAELKPSVIHSLDVPKKRVIRRITPLDPKKLQQAGLDRKIAEALSKQKFQQSGSKPLNRFSNMLTSMSPKDSSSDAINPIISKPTIPTNVQEVSPVKNPVTAKKIILPKITITGPQLSTELEMENLAGLNSHQRLVHVKNILNKKLHEKKSADMKDNAQTYEHIKPTSTKCSSQYKLPIQPAKETIASPSLFCILKEPVDVLTPTMSVKLPKTPQKSPQDIARKLDFQTDSKTKAAHPAKRNNIKCCTIEIQEIPKASIKAGKSQQELKSLPSTVAQNCRQLKHGGQLGSVKQSYSMVNITHEAPNFQAEYLKQQKIIYNDEIPKASIKISQGQQQYSYSPYSYKQLKQSDQILDFPEVSPLKVPFPTINVPKETPLPAIDSFKKPYSMANSVYYDQPKIGEQNDFMLTNNETSLFNQNPTTSLVTSNLTSTVTNSLIVLENKVLSQDEMIDLTELRLSSSKIDTPGFLNPHKPIPEVVIKQENTEEYPLIDISSPVGLIETAPEIEAEKEIKTQNNVTSTEKLVMSKKQNKKIIINAQKLKLPPEQLADLAKKIKQNASASNASAKRNEPNQLNKVQDIRILNTKAASRKTPTKHTAYVGSHKTENIAQSPMEMQNQFIIQNMQIYGDDNQATQTQQCFKTIEGGNYFMARQPDAKPMNNSENDKNKQPNVDKPSDEIMIIVKDDTKISNSCGKLQKHLQENLHDTMTDNVTSLTNYCKSAVEIVDVPVDTEDSFSAVDFIAALSNINPITEETSLELSPEELNLNASCAMNLSPLRIQSYPPYKRTSICQKSPLAERQQPMSTIVIESSKGAETILSNDSLNKCEDLKRANKLQTVEVIQEMKSEKASQTLLTVGSPRKYSTIPPLDSLDTKSFNVTANQFIDPKTHDNLVVCDMDIEKSLATFITNPSVKKQDDRKGLKRDNKLSTDYLRSTATNTACSEGSSATPKVVLEPLEQRNTGLTNLKVGNDPNRTISISNVQPNKNVTEVYMSATAIESSKEQNLFKTVIVKNKTRTPKERSLISPIKSREVSHFNPQCNKFTESTENETNITNNESQYSTIFKNVESNLQNILPNTSLQPDKILENLNDNSDCSKSQRGYKQILESETNPANDHVKSSKCPEKEVDQKPELGRITVKATSPTPLGNDDISTNTNNIMNFNKKSEVSKGNELSSISTVTSKRISRFKKGKINLVQRNKTSQATNKALSGDNNNEVNKSFNDIFNKDQTIDSENKVAKTLITEEERKGEGSELHKKSNDSLNDIEKDTFNAKNQADQCKQVMCSTRTKEIQNTEEINNSLSHNSIQQIIPKENERFPQECHIEKDTKKADLSQVSPLTKPLKASMQTTKIKSTSNAASKYLGSNIVEDVNSSKRMLKTILNTDDINIPKASIKIGITTQQHTKSPENKESQQSSSFPNESNVDKQKKHSIGMPDITIQQGAQENTSPSQAAISDTSTQFEPPEFQTTKTQQTKANDLNKIENLNPESKAILKCMKSAKISLIDIVKHSPIKSLESCATMSFKSICNESSKTSLDVKDINTGFKGAKSSCKEQHEHEYLKQQVENVISNEQPSISIKEARKSLPKVDEQNLLQSTRSCRSGSKTSERQIETPSPSIATRKRHPTRPLISDDDLEFLPENAEVKFKLSRSKRNEKNKESKEETTTSFRTALTNETLNRRQRLYSKPLELELTSPTSALTKRARYYSQTLETNVTITFDKFKSKGNFSKKFEPLEIEESCQDSKQDSIMATPTKQHQRLCKTLDDVNKSHNDTYSEDDNQDYDCLMNDCEESNEFLGFEDISDSSSFKNTPHNIKENYNEANTRHGTLQNWLTTGKAISPTFDKMVNTKRLQDDDNLPASSTSSSARRLSKGLVPLKKRWDLCSKLNEESDITDDTSPADDEEEQIPKSKKFKRIIKNVIDNNNDIVDKRKTKLGDSMENSIFEHPNLDITTKTSATDSNCHKEEDEKAKQNQIMAKNLPKTIELKVVATDSEFKEEKRSTFNTTAKNVEGLVESSATEADCLKEKSSKGTVSHCQYSTELNNIKKPNKRTKTSQKHSNKPSKESHFRDKKESQELELKHTAKSSKKSKETDKVIDKCLTLKSSTADFDSQGKNNEIDKNVQIGSISHILEADLEPASESKISRHSKSKQKVKNEKMVNVDVPQHQKSLRKSEMENENSRSKEQNRDTNLSITAELSLNTSDSSKKIAVDDNGNSTITMDKVETENVCTTPQNSTIKRKRGRPKSKPTENTFSSSDKTAKTKILKQISNDRDTSLHIDLKRTIISDSSADESPLSFAKKRSLKVPSKRKLKIEDNDSDSTTTPLNQGQANENFMKSSEPIATPTLALTKSETSTPTLGRKRKCTTESNFNPRLLLITKREQLDTDVIITETEPGLGAIKCGLCLQRTEPAKWKIHLAEHYGVGWKDGETKLNIENRSVVLSNILNYMKDTGSKGLTCRMCKKVYRSALGLLMHIEACGAQSIRVACEFCKKDYAKTTLPIHLRSCYARSALENESSDENPDESIGKKEEIFGNSGRLKRNSTIKAENKLKVLGAELEKVTDNVNTENSKIDPKSRIRYVPPLQGDFSVKWSKDIKKRGQASCPKTRCKYTSNDVKKLSEHIKNCKYIKSGYFCNFCRQRVFKSEKEAIEHVIKSHKNGRRRKKSDDSDCDMKIDDEQSSDDSNLSEGVNESELDDDNAVDEADDVDGSNRKRNKRQQSKTRYSRNVNQSTNQTSRKEVFDGRFTDLNKEVLRKWKCFLKSNYSSEPLYIEFPTQYCVVNQPNFYKYLPSQTVSMKFNFKTKSNLNATIGVPENNVEWSELKRYESITNKMNTYFFLGAPVKLCSWLPLPAHVNEQYLAVVYRQEMFKFIKFTQPKQHHTIILIIKVTQNSKVPELNAHYGFMINDGPVHHVAFLPSGGYDESSNRLGLVAVATVTSCISVYSLPINVELLASAEKNYSSSDQNITLIAVKPSFLLSLDTLYQTEKQHVLLNPQCLQICWSEYSGHQHIFASFSNGFMGMWAIANDPQQNLNRFVIDDIIHFAPLNYFYVGEKRIKCFALHYDTCGPRWLAVSGAYRKFVIYDIQNFMQPVIMKEEVNKNILLSMDWCPLWETILYSYCDTIQNNGRCVIAVNPTNVMFSQNKLDFMVCGVTQVHYTPVTNMCVTALNNGDIVFLDTKELHYECALSKKFGERRMLYTMDVKQLNGEPLVRLAKGNQKYDTTETPKDWLMYDENYKKKYGLIFEPLIKLKENDRKAYLSENRCPPVNMIPLMRINTLRCNFNLSAKNLIALGYENGFLRLIYFNKENVFSH